MISLFGVYSTLLLRSGFFLKTPSSIYIAPSCKRSFNYLGNGAVKLELILTGVLSRCYSAKITGGGSARKQKVVDKSLMQEDKDVFFVIRKGDLVGVYKSLSDCEAQVGTSICDPPVSVYKGYSIPKDTEKYLHSCGLTNALYSMRATDLTQELFGTLMPCPIQPSSSISETASDPVVKKSSHEVLLSEFGEVVDSTKPKNDVLWRQLQLEPPIEDQKLSACQSCTLEIDGASKGNPGQAGAGAVLRLDDGSMICRLREGLGIATNNSAEYRAFILGLKYALGKGFTSVRVQSDSKLVCMQIQGLWRVKNQNIFVLYEEAKKLKDRFLSFQIIHVLRDFNSEADAQANLAVHLAEGQIQEEIDK